MKANSVLHVTIHGKIYRTTYYGDSKNIWAEEYGNGLIFYMPPNKKFKHHTLSESWVREWELIL